MKSSLQLTVTSLSLMLTSCAGLFGTKTEFQRGVEAGKAQVIRRIEWEARNKPIEPPPVLERRYTPIEVPEYTTPDGVIIEAHREIVETVH